MVLRTIRVNGQECNGLIDTGCSKTILSPQIHVEPKKIIAQKGTVLSFDGKAIPHEGEAEVTVEMAGRTITVRALRCARVVSGADVIVGMDVLSQYVVTINWGWLNVSAVASQSSVHRITNKSFEVVFDVTAWTARWEWTSYHSHVTSCGSGGRCQKIVPS